MARSGVQLLNHLYTHKPVNRNEDEIRLLRIDLEKPEPYEEPLHCGSLYTFKLNESPNFVALSYEWNSLPGRAHIMVDRKLHEVSSNLVDFLSSYRLVAKACQPFATSSHAWIWIDQICIDQTSDIERHHQVSLMTSIYSQALEVIAWLGKRCESTLKFLQGKGVRKWYATGGDGPSLRFLDLASARPFLANSYWSRPWIQQEIAMAKKVVFMAGTAHLYASEISQLANDLEMISSGNGRLPFKPALLQALRGAHSPELRLRSLGDVLKQYSYARKKCTDDRDQIFGLQAMVRQDERVEPDYTLNVHELFVQTVMKIGDSRDETGKRFGVTLIGSWLSRLNIDMIDGLRLYRCVRDYDQQEVLATTGQPRANRDAMKKIINSFIELQARPPYHIKADGLGQAVPDTSL